MNRYKLALLFLLLALLFPIGIPAQTDTAVKVLLVNAHPDDESGCAATVYKITHDLKGVVDLAVITNGEAGYKYSTLAESIYGMELTEEAVGREFLPTIRKRELMNGGKWVGIRNYYFMEQKDTRYSTDPSEVMNTGVWNLAQVKQRLTEIILRERYDYIFACFQPMEHMATINQQQFWHCRQSKNCQRNNARWCLAFPTRQKGTPLQPDFPCWQNTPKQKSAVASQVSFLIEP